jgi:hypothetical protein
MMQSYFENAGAFDPEDVDAMARAFSETCYVLRIFAGDAHGREVIATRIIELARFGLTDPAAIRDRVVWEARTAA